MNTDTDQEIITETKDVPLPRSRRIPWLPLFFAVLTVITYFMVSGTDSNSNSNSSETPASIQIGSPPSPIEVPAATVGSTDQSDSFEDNSVNNTLTTQSAGAPAELPADYNQDYPSPQDDGEPTANDTREFLQIIYQATVQTLHVQELTSRIETVIRGHGGRVDQVSSSPQYGSISFVIPQDQFDDFRTEFEGMVNWRFLTVDISSENLLPQKQDIEAQATQASSSLADLTASREQLVAAHASTVSSLQAQINADTQDLASLEAQSSTDSAQQAQINAEIQSVSADQSSLKSRLASVNATYAANLQNADSNIQYAQQNIDSIQTQDQNLTDTVATVSGTISLNSITFWQIVLLYLPGYWIPVIFAILTILSYLWDRRRYGPSILGF